MTDQQIKIRAYKNSDASKLHQLFFNTVRMINISDYTQAQIEAWAPSDYDRQAWTQHMQTLNPFIAEINGHIVGYADLQSDGLIDHFFCHHQYQGCGVGKALMQHLLQKASEHKLKQLYSYVSITAKPFFQHFGFIQDKQQSVAIRGQELINFKMILIL